MLIVCNEKPDLALDDPRIEFLTVNFDRSGTGKGKAQSQIDCWMDKGAKVAAGLLHLKITPPESVFIMDADDWVDRRIVEHVLSNPKVGFWYADAGYLVDYGDKTLIRKRGMVRYTGTSLISNYSHLMSLIDLPRTLSSESSRQAFEKSIDPFILVHLLGHHRYQLGFLHRHGIKAEKLPFRSVCWLVNTGENRSGATALNSGLPLHNTMLSDFGLGTNLLGVTQESPSISCRLKESRQRLLSTIGWSLTPKNVHKV